MKILLYNSFIVLLTLGLLTGCKKEVKHTTSSQTNKNTIDGKWNLMRIYGGISGADEVHSAGEIEWIFDTPNGTLTVYNTIGNSSYYSLPSGTYPFQQITGPTENYLVINASELGQITFSGNELLIDENKKSTGEGACGFYLTLHR